MKNKINIYSCSNGHEVITVNRDEGTTPFLIECPHCKAEAQSRFYQVPQNLTPTHEWYAPTDDEFTEEYDRAVLSLAGIDSRGLKKSMAEHRNRGGLSLRKV